MQITDITIIGAWRGPARLQLFEHVLAPLADLPVREIVVGQPHRGRPDARPAALVHDYLASHDELHQWIASGPQSP